MYSIFEQLCSEKGVTPYRVCKETGLTTSTISNWKAGRYTPKHDKLKRIADYFGVSVQFLITGKEENTEEIERSRIVNMNLQMDEILSADTLMFDGKPIDPESAELLQKQIEIALETIRLKRKK